MISNAGMFLITELFDNAQYLQSPEDGSDKLYSYMATAFVLVCCPIFKAPSASQERYVTHSSMTLVCADSLLILWIGF